jgi:transient receptor potential cation channel subfamily A member 1
MFYELNCAAAESEDAALALLERGASLGTRDRTDRMMVQYLDDDVLRKFLDSRITTRKPQNMSDNDFFLVMDYSFLESPKEMLPIEFISEAPNLQPLIVHPVIASFMFLKWFQLSNIFYLNLLLFSVNTISSCLFFMIVYVEPDQTSDDSMWKLILKTTTIFSFLIFLLKEVGQLLSSPKAYLGSAENYFEIGLLCLMGMALFTPLGDGHDQFRRVITSIFIMGIAFEWTLMFSALPMFTVTNYIVMLKKVAVNFLRMLAFYSVILIAFALSFYTLMGAPVEILGNSTAPSMDTTIFETILMMTGDFGLYADNEENVWIFRIFLIIFILSITIVLMNLLLGLTISDTAAIESHAELHNWLERAKLLSKYETMVSNW